MKHHIFNNLLLSIVLANGMTTLNAQDPICRQTVTGKTTTTVTITDLELSAAIDPMIYGLMLEDCNDSVVYGGIVDKDGTENNTVTKMLKDLQIPVMRWPAGTAIYDYDWKKGVGSERRPQKELIWGGYEYYTFGTDEFVEWCRKVGTQPYINIPIGNNNAFNHSVENSMEWVEYVNGDPKTPWGAYRSHNGHEAPYGVSYFCLGNENYLGNKFHKVESAEEYAGLLLLHATAIKKKWPEAKLLGVGHKGSWNKVVTDKCGPYLDFLTMHYYMTARIKDRQLQEPQLTLFAPELVEANLRHFIGSLKEYNAVFGRNENPIRLSIDEWNCRHSVFDGNKYHFTRKDARRLYDAAIMAGMLNVFIRTSPYVGMANYIFPVNGHGLVKTVGQQDAYPSACYHLYQLYRKLMTGRTVGVEVVGPGIKDLEISALRVEGDTDDSQKGRLADCCFIDAAAVTNSDGLAVALVNRSYDKAQKIKLTVPAGYRPLTVFKVSATDVCAENSADNRTLLKSGQTDMKSQSMTLHPCATAIVLFGKKQNSHSF